jgi:hypothetical protein
MTRGDAEAAVGRIGTEVQGLGVRCTITRTLPRAAYWEGMFEKRSE